MLFSSTKAGHLGQILSTGLFGEILTNSLVPPSPDQVQAWGSMLIQLAVALVTIWATVRKALQKPESVVKLLVPPSPTPAVPTDGDAQ